MPCCIVCNIAKSSRGFGAFVSWVMEAATHLKITRHKWNRHIKTLFTETEQESVCHPISRAVAQGVVVNSPRRRTFTRKKLENASKLHTLEEVALYLKTDPLTAKAKLRDAGLSVLKKKTFAEKTSLKRLRKAYKLAMKKGLESAASFMKCSRDTISFAFKSAGFLALRPGVRRNTR